MQANIGSAVWRRVIIGLAGLALCLLLWPAGPAQAAPLGAARFGDTVTYTVQAGDSLRSIAAQYGVSIGAIVRANDLSDPDRIYPGQRLTIPAAGSALSVTATAVPAPALPATAAPSQPAASPGSAAVPAAPVYHTVGLGDTLANIAASYGVSVAQIIAINAIDNPDLIWVGQRLQISDAAAAAAPTVAPTRPAEVIATPVPLATAQPTLLAAPAAGQPQPTAQVPVQPTPAPALPKPTVYTVQPGDTLGSIAQAFGVTVASLVGMNDLPNANILGIGQQLIIPLPGSLAANFKPTKMLVDISEQRCYIYQDETLVAKWVCSTGRPGTGTRPGSYKIQSKLAKAYGSTWDIWMPYWLGIYWAGASENGIHGLPWNADTGAQIWRGSVGTPITFGCVMLDNVNAKMLYDMAYIGMPVIIRP